MLFYYPNPKHILNQNNLTKVMDGILRGYKGGGGGVEGSESSIIPQFMSPKTTELSSIRKPVTLIQTQGSGRTVQQLSA